MVEENILFYILPSLSRIIEIPAGIPVDHSVAEGDPEIFELEPVQKYAGHKKHPVRPLKLGRGVDLPERDIHICHTVLESCLLCGIFERMEIHREICRVLSGSFNMRRVPFIQRIDQMLLQLPVLLVIHRVDLHDLVKNRLKIFADGRHRISDDGKAPVLLRDIAVRDPDPLRLHPGHFCRLRLGERNAGTAHRRSERLYPERLEDCRAGMRVRLLLMRLVAHSECPEAFRHIFIVKEQTEVLAVIVIELHIRDRAGVSVLPVPALRDQPRGRAQEGRSEAHFLEIPDRGLHHSLKPKLIDDLDRLFIRQVLSHLDKAEPESFRKRVRHPVDLLLRQAPEIPGSLKDVFRDIFSEPVQIIRPGIVGIHDNVAHKGMRVRDLLLYPLGHIIRKIILAVGSENIPDRRDFRNLSAGKIPVNLKKQLKENADSFRIVLKNAGNDSPKLRIHSREDLSHPVSEHFCRIVRIRVRVTVVLRKNILIERCIIRILSDRKKEAGDFSEIASERFRNARLERYLIQPVQGQIKSFIHSPRYPFLFLMPALYPTSATGFTLCIRLTYWRAPSGTGSAIRS